MKNIIVLLLISLFVDIAAAQPMQNQLKSYEQKPTLRLIIAKDSLQKQGEYRMSINRYLNPLTLLLMTELLLWIKILMY